MSSIGDMLAVVMDGITDTELLLDYADNADAGHVKWFMDRAKRRYQMTTEDYENVMSMSGLKERAAEGDEIANALMDHLRKQMHRLNARM